MSSEELEESSEILRYMTRSSLKLAVLMCLCLAAHYVIVKTISGERLRVVRLRFKSRRPGETAIVLGYVRALAPLLTICLHWHEGEVCVFVLLVGSNHNMLAHLHTCILSSSEFACFTTCLGSVFTAFVQRVMLHTCTLCRQGTLLHIRTTTLPDSRHCERNIKWYF